MGCFGGSFRGRGSALEGPGVCIGDNHSRKSQRCEDVQRSDRAAKGFPGKKSKNQRRAKIRSNSQGAADFPEIESKMQRRTSRWKCQNCQGTGTKRKPKGTPPPIPPILENNSRQPRGQVGLADANEVPTRLKKWARFAVSWGLDPVGCHLTRPAWQS